MWLVTLGYIVPANTFYSMLDISCVVSVYFVIWHDIFYF
jgi:hypothetical protein